MPGIELTQFLIHFRTTSLGSGFYLVIPYFRCYKERNKEKKVGERQTEIG
jgi:hypothetical protein